MDSFTVVDIFEKNELKKELENTDLSIEQKLDIQDRIKEINTAIKEIKAKKKEYFLIISTNSDLVITLSFCNSIFSFITFSNSILATKYWEMGRVGTERCQIFSEQ